MQCVCGVVWCIRDVIRCVQDVVSSIGKGSLWDSTYWTQHNRKHNRKDKDGCTPTCAHIHTSTPTCAQIYHTCSCSTPPKNTPHWSRSDRSNSVCAFTLDATSCNCFRFPSTRRPISCARVDNFDWGFCTCVDMGFFCVGGWVGGCALRMVLCGMCMVLCV